MEKKKNNYIFIIVIVIALALLVAIYLLKDKVKAQISKNTSQPLPPPDSAPDPAQTTLLETESGQGKSLIDNRMRQIFQNELATRDVIIKYNVPLPNRNGLNYPAGVAQVLNDAGEKEVPVVPAWAAPSYEAEIDNFIAQTDFEMITFNQGFESAEKTYQNAMAFDSVQFYPWTPLKKAVVGNAFGRVKASDKDRSNDFNTATKDFKVLMNKVKDSNKKLGDAIKQQAIADLRAVGYKFKGFDV